MEGQIGGKRSQSQHENMGMRFGGVKKLSQGTELNAM